MNVQTTGLDTPVETLSGGNQQKVVLAKWMITDPDILILDEPTRGGIDVGAKYEIYKLMMELAKKEKAIIMVSSELPELIGMCDRIYVMAKGSIMGGMLRRDEFTQENIMTYATKAKKERELII